uniref:Uncharacterized protein n=1 Tax=Ditylenchus dipsaci TaxID=166011 RepID=A0A915DD63_9BILA
MAPTTVSPPTSNGYGGQYAPGHGSPLNSPSGKPPLPRRQISVDSSNGSGNPGGSIYSPPSQRANHIPKTAVTNHHHPLSISANDLSSPQDSFVLRHDAAGGGRRHPATSRPVSLTGCSDLQQSQTNFLNPSGHCSTSLLAEALQQIDQLAVELDSGLNKIDATYGGEGIAGTSSRLPPSYLALGEGIVRYRPQHQMQHQDNSHRPPPPPQRR